MRELLINYLTNLNDINLLGQLIANRVKEKYPQKYEDEIIQFTQIFIQMLMMPFNDMANQLLHEMLSLMKVEEEIVELQDKEGQIIKYY
jgi:hypothetical protein